MIPGPTFHSLFAPSFALREDKPREIYSLRVPVYPAGLTGGDGEPFRVNYDDETLTTTHDNVLLSYLTVKDHGIGRDKLKGRLSGRHKVNTSLTYEFEPGETSIPFNAVEWTNDDENFLAITSGSVLTGEPFKIKAKKEIGLRISACVSIEGWDNPLNGKCLDLYAVKGSTYFKLNSFLVQSNANINSSIVTLAGTTIFNLSSGDEIKFVIANNSSANAFLQTGDGCSHISFEEV